MHEIEKLSAIKKHFSHLAHAVEHHAKVMISGTVIRISGMKIDAVGLRASIGTPCLIEMNDNTCIHAEIIGFSDATTYLMASESIEGLQPGARVTPLFQERVARVGYALLGRVIDSAGCPMDGGSELKTTEYYPLYAKPLNPLMRKEITEPLDVGIKAINALLTVGKGQRIGIFAGSGVGKSVLLGMMTQFTQADVVVVGLVGERGREVKEFIEKNLGETGRKKSVIVAAPSDTSPLRRIHCALLANTIAEYYRDQGLSVLLIVDSLTRFAQAHREVALSVGEPPATKGFTPSVFAHISQLVERAGYGTNPQGSVTAFYTVLSEEGEFHDPIADHIRSVLDGHIVLSKHLADAGHYPAIDIEKSISRVMPSIIDASHFSYAMRFKQLYSAYQQNKELIQVGMYQHGTDPVMDEAIKHRVTMQNFLKQGMHERADFNESTHHMLQSFTTT